MADGALHITREQLSQALGGNQRAIRLLESLIREVSTTLPESIDQVQLSTLFSLHGADGSKSAANNALALTLELESLTQACRRQAESVQVLRGEVEQLRAELHDARARLASATHNAQAAADQALALTIGV